MKPDLERKIKDLPQIPGVYIYYDGQGEVIYVGKAKNLRSRVGSYFNTKIDRSTKTYKLVQSINDIKFIVVENEFDALILEAELIKKYLPKYNIVLKDDKSFLYISIKKDRLPSVSALRKTNLNSKDTNFGPYTSSAITKQIVRIVRKIFPYRDCTESKFKKYEKLKTPCLFGQIKLCPAPCINKDIDSLKIYKENIRKIKKLLSGDSSEVIRILESNMRKFSKNKEYEKAAIVRDTLNKMNYIRKYYRNAGDYIDNPKLIEDINRKAIEELKILIPTIKKLPERIECYDIANISGKDAVGSMVVATKGEMDRDEYRRFRINFRNTPDDVDMIYDVLTRRFNHGWEIPDLLVVDGGKPQVSAAERALEDKNICLPVIGLAKKYETIVFRSSGVFYEIKPEKDNSGILLLIKLRDEAHRFAQSYHHLLRLKSLGV